MGVHFLSQYRNPLAYPAGYAPGFDPSHPASAGLRFSGIAGSGGFIDLMTGIPGTLTGTPTPAVNGVLGPHSLMSATGYSYTGRNTSAVTRTTFAGIFSIAAAGDQFLFSAGGAATCSTMCVSIISNDLRYNEYGNADLSSGLSLTTNVPYFAAMSGGAGGWAFVLKSLHTGVTRFSTAGSRGVRTGDGTYRVGMNPVSAQGLNGRLAAVMYSTNGLSISDLLQWAADPWSFWYPNPGDNWIAAQAAAGGLFKITGNPRSLAGFGGGLAA